MEAQISIIITITGFAVSVLIASELMPRMQKKLIPIRSKKEKEPKRS